MKNEFLPHDTLCVMHMTPFIQFVKIVFEQLYVYFLNFKTKHNIKRVIIGEIIFFINHPSVYNNITLFRVR